MGRMSHLRCFLPNTAGTVIGLTFNLCRGVLEAYLLAPVTIITFPLRSGMSFTEYVALGGQVSFVMEVRTCPIVVV